MHAEILALIGVVTPLLVAIVARARTSSARKGALALLFSVLIGLGTVYAGGAFTMANVAGSILAALGAAQAVYTVAFKPLGITSWILDNLGRVDPPAST